VGRPPTSSRALTMNLVLTTHRGEVLTVLAAPAAMALRMWFRKLTSAPAPGSLTRCAFA
jgi:hypothetical protein